MGRWTAPPPRHRLLWLVGVRAPPPPFCSFAFNASMFGVYSSVVWGATLWIAVWQTSGGSPVNALVAAAVARVRVAVPMAAFIRAQRSKHDLP